MTITNRAQFVERLIKHKQCLAIMGPTASGKSQLSMDLAALYPIEIISVDSALIYRGMDIGTAKPSSEELSKVAHHLINTHDPADSYSASEFVAEVTQLVNAIFSRGHLPVLVGGTMMYFNALQQGMNDLPPADENIRKALQKIWQETPELLHQRLIDIDPVSAQRIHQHDPQRLIRALEVHAVSGKTLTALRAEPKKGLTEFSLIKVGLIPEARARLHQQIVNRFKNMLDNGFLQEVKGLMLRGDLDADKTSIRSVGYRQAWSFLQGEMEYDTFLDKGVIATRQLAKRQMTWLRKEPDLHVIDPFTTTRDERVKIVADLIESPPPIN